VECAASAAAISEHGENVVKGEFDKDSEEAQKGQAMFASTPGELMVRVPQRVLSACGGFILYIVEVTRRLPQGLYERWKVQRRFQSFRNLFQRLQASIPSVPSPPPRTLFRSMEPSFLDRRQLGLNIWLRRLVAGLGPQNEILQAFLLGDYVGVYKNPVVTTRDPVPYRISPMDFEPLCVLGKGTFGTVKAVREIRTGNKFAMKVLCKDKLLKNKLAERARAERHVMGVVSHPFIVKLHYAFQTKARLFLVLELVPGGELFFHMGLRGKFPAKTVKVWTAEIVLVLEYLHDKDIVYRDLKPENILLDARGHIKIVDFGLCKNGISGYVGGTRSFCGTPEYIAPEVITRHGHGKAVDFWSLGCVAYELLTGLPPWYTEDHQLLFKRILRARYPRLEGGNKTENDLLRGLLERQPLARLGTGMIGRKRLREHAFFNGLDWSKVLRKEVSSGYLPCIDANQAEKGVDTSNFDKIFTNAKMSMDMYFDE